MTKKVIVTAMAAVLSVGVASADLSVSWFNTSAAVSDGVGLVNDNLVQLLWSATGNTTAAGGYNVLGGTTQAGEFVLAQTTDHAASPAVGFWGPISGVYTSADVGGADINAGFFFSRVFETAGAEVGTHFFDVDVVDTADWVFNNLLPGTTYSGEAIVDNTTLNPGGTLDVTSNATTVIPEPATFGLMGLAGLGLFLARKKARR